MRTNRPPMYVILLVLLLIDAFLVLVLSTVGGPSLPDNWAESLVVSLAPATSTPQPPPTFTITPTPTVTPTPTATPTPLTADAERVVSAMYDAISRDDQPAYMGTISPNSRSAFKFDRVLRGIILNSNLDAFPLPGGMQIDVVALSAITYRVLRINGIYQADGYVTVRAEGWAYFLNSTIASPMCDTWDVHRYEGNQWLVDAEAPERKDRQARIVDMRIRSDPNLVNLPQILSQPLAQWGKGLELILMMCE
jgi:hypothetical protein